MSDEIHVGQGDTAAGKGVENGGAIMNELRIAIILITVAVLFAIATPCHAQQTVKVVRACNLRSGPGMSYARVGGVWAGDVLGVWASQPEWYKVGAGTWIAVFCTGDYNPKP